MTTVTHFHAGDRVQALHPIDLFAAHQSGIILREYPVLNVSDVVFDGQMEPRIVANEHLSLVAPAPTPQAQSLSLLLNHLAA
jgi:hypothetical protein